MTRPTPPVPVPLSNMGQPVPRYQAADKVTGAQPYVADVPIANLLHARLVTSAIAKGRIVAIDDRAAALPGVVRIYTYLNAPRRIPPRHSSAGGRASDSRMPLASDMIEYGGQIVAMVVAETPEIARDAAQRLVVRYEEGPATATFDQRGATTSHPQPLARSAKQVGNFDEAYAAAPVRIDQRYSTPAQHHNTIELFSTTAVWEGDQLTLHESSRWVHNLANGIAETIGFPPEKVRVKSPFMGGSFGSRSFMMQHSGLVSLAARELGRPIKLLITRSQGYAIDTYRAETRQRVRLAAERSGNLVAFGHEGLELSSRPDNYSVAGTAHTAEMYGYGNVLTRVSLVHADRNTPGFMRSPAELPYMFALETAMDEMAIELNLDPVELRRINDTQLSPITGAPFTSRSLMKCFDQAAESFGWAKRNPVPGSMTDGDWQVGYGCAAASYPVLMQACAARIVLTPNGKARVEVAVHDVGAGAYTAMQQIAARELGLASQDVTVLLGDSRLPAGPPAGGSMTTASGGSAIFACAAKIRERFGGRMPRVREFSAAFERLNVNRIEEYTEWSPFGPAGMEAINNGRAFFPPPPPPGTTNPPRPVRFSFGANFVEVRIHRLTREIRVARITGAFEGGYIVNPRLARSQYMAGMIWGVASALHESTELDLIRARYVNDNLAEYLVAVSADIPQVDVIMVPEVDNQVNPIGVKGIGELSNVGTAAAVSNAVFHATGKRIRDLPITMDKLLTV